MTTPEIICAILIAVATAGYGWATLTARDTSDDFGIDHARMLADIRRERFARDAAWFSRP